MRRTMSKILSSTILALVLTACGSNSDGTPSTLTATQETGGSAGTLSTTSVAGVAGLDTPKSTGGSSSAPDSTGGGSTVGSSTVATSTGGQGSLSSGGSKATGGSSTKATGGSTSTGGSSTKATGGSSVKSTGGNQSTGGSRSTGGSSTVATSTGGSSSTGGGSTQLTGGSSSTGGSSPQATGGSSPSTGGTSSTGGSPMTATGGSTPSTGGNPSTGGSSSQATGGSTSNKLTASQVSVGTTQTCVVVADGRIQCWGSNDMGQLGDGTTTTHTSPVFVNGISTAVSVSTYTNHTCALLGNGTVWCWGLNMYGELGNGVATANDDYPLNMSPNPNPVQFLGVINAIAVSVGQVHTCVILADHTVECVGFRGDQGGDTGNGGGLLGDGVPRSPTNYYSTTPVQVLDINNAKALGSNSNYTCALLSDETIKCWGYAIDSEFTGNSLGVALSPVAISGITDATQISVGPSNICYQSQNNNGSFCWGATASGQFGGTPSSSYPPTTTPYRVGGATTYQQVTLLNSKVVIGADHGCVVYNRPSLTTASVIGCFGNNAFGQLGDGTQTNSNSGVIVSGITNAQDISAGGSTTCAILSTGSLQCWGSEPGNSTSSSTTPVTVSGF